VPWRAVIAWLLVAPCAAWVVVRALGLERGYPLVPLLAYTPLAAAGSIVAAVAAALLRVRIAAVVAAIAAVALIAYVAPRVLGGASGAEGGSGPRLRVLTANLYQQPGAVPGLVDIVRRTRPDVLSLQEVTPRVARALEASGLKRLLPERVQDPRAGGFGSALYARVPLRRGEIPVGQTVTVARARVRGAPPVEVFAVHPRAPLRAENMDEWEGDLRAIPAATPRGAVRILAGDFNATLDHAELRRVLDTGYEDAAEAVGAGLRATWPSNRRFPPPVTIDHVLADARCGVRSARVMRVPRSDHRAVLADLVLPRAAGR
jgi:endonuclease/exonuclease/phosphatase (EEP) superfamily protein YafD